MSSVNQVMAGSAFVKIFLDNGELKAGIQNSQSRIGKFVSALNKWSGEVALTSAVLTLPFKKALDTFADFDLKMRQVRAITGASSSALGELSEQARKLGRSTSFTTSEVANAMVVLGRIGFTSREVGKSVKSVMNLAKATGSELSTAVNVAGNQLRIFGKGVDEISHVADVVTYTVNRSAMSLDEFQEAAAKAGPNFANSNSTIEQMAGSLAVLANMGIKSSIAGTALSRAIKRLADPGVEEMLVSYGVRVKELNGDLRPFHRILADTAKVMAQLPSAKRIRMAEEMFGARGSMAGLPLTMNAKAIEDFMRGFDDIAGIAEETATAMDKGMFGALKRLASAINDVYISIGQLTSTTLVGWIESLSKAINKFSTSDGFLIYFTRVFTLTTTLVGGFGLVTKAVLMFGTAIKAMYSPLLKLDALVTMVAEKEANAAAEKERSAKLHEAYNRRVEASDKARTASELSESAKRSAAAAAEAKSKEAENLKQIATNNDIISKAQAAGKVSAAASAPGLSALAASVESARGEVVSLENANKALRDQLSIARAAKDKEQIASLNAQIAANKVLIEQAKEKKKAAVEAQKAGKAAADAQIHSQDALIASTKAQNAELRRQSKLLHEQVTITNRVARADAAKAEVAKKEADRAESIARTAEANVPPQTKQKDNFQEYLAKRDAVYTAKRKATLLELNAYEASVNAQNKAMEEEDFRRKIENDQALLVQRKASLEQELVGARMKNYAEGKAIQQREGMYAKMQQETASRVAGIQSEIAANEQLIASYTKTQATKKMNYSKYKETMSNISSLKAEQQQVLANANTEQARFSQETENMRMKYTQHRAYVESLREELNLVTAKFYSQRSQLGTKHADAEYAAGDEVEKQKALAKATEEVASAQKALDAIETPAMKRNAKAIQILMKRGGVNMFLAATSSKHAQAIMNLGLADVAAAAKSAGASGIRIAGYVAEAAAVKVVAAVTWGFNAALTAIAAHPVMVFLVALAATFALLKRNIDKAVKSANGDIAVMDAEAEKNQKAAEAMKKRMSEEQKGIKYLQDLENQGYATSEQQAAAMKIIDALSAKYGDLGITISDLTGKIEGAVDAQKALNDAQRAEAMQQNINEQKTAQKTVDALGTGLVATASQKTSVWRKMVNYTSGVGGKDAELLRMLGFGYQKDSWYKNGEWKNDKLGRLSEMAPTELMQYREQVSKALMEVIGWGDDYSTQREEVKKLLDQIDMLIEKRKEFVQLMDEGVKNEDQKDALPEVKEAPSQADAERAMQSLQKISEANRNANQSSLSQTLDGIREQRREYEKMSSTAYKFYENELKLAEAGRKEAEKPVAADLAGSLGVYGRGNIDLYDRPVLKNDDGSISTVESMSFLENGLEVLIPTIARGLNGEAIRLSEEEAIKRYKQTGEYLGKFSTVSEANAYAENLHKQQSAYYENRNNDYMTAMVAGQRAQSQMDRIKDAQAIQERAFLDQEVRAKQEDYFARGEKEMQRQKDMDNFGGAMAMLTRLIYDNSAAWRNATAEYNRTMADAAKAGVFNGTASDDVRNSYNDRLQGLAALMEQQRDRDIELRKEYNSSIQTKSVGSFSAAALNRLMGNGGVQERIANATRRTAEYLARITELNRQKLTQQKELNNSLGMV